MNKVKPHQNVSKVNESLIIDYSKPHGIHPDNNLFRGQFSRNGGRFIDCMVKVIT